MEFSSTTAHEFLQPYCHTCIAHGRSVGRPWCSLRSLCLFSAVVSPLGQRGRLSTRCSNMPELLQNVEDRKYRTCKLRSLHKQTDTVAYGLASTSCGILIRCVTKRGPEYRRAMAVTENTASLPACTVGLAANPREHLPLGMRLVIAAPCVTGDA